ncbi:hypothetical protein WHE01_13630 [Weissella hellenica]|nr:hypothetical protein WHE01_13630 [Weissella hellenica]
MKITINVIKTILMLILFNLSSNYTYSSPIKWLITIILLLIIWVPNEKIINLFSKDRKE